MPRLLALARRLRRRVLRHRRGLAAVAAVTAVLAGHQALTAPAPRTVVVVTAAHDLGAGTVLTRADLRRTEFLPGSVPDGVPPSTRAVLGRTVSAPLRAGEPITDARLVSGGLLTGRPGDVAVPVRIADAGATALLRVGDTIDVLAADPRGGAALPVASGATVLALPGPDRTAAGVGGGLVVLALSPDTARAVTGAATSGYLSLVLTH